MQSLHSTKNLFDETALLKWNKIVEKQIGVTP